MPLRLPAALGSRRYALCIGMAAVVVAVVGTAIVYNDAREKRRCSARGDASSLRFQSTVEWPERFVGLPEAAARGFAERSGYVSRVICRDGQDLLVTKDLSVNRINLGVHHGQVVGYRLG